jgi:parvulin-like peptidyl-prolyl isomerase
MRRPMRSARIAEPPHVLGVILLPLLLCLHGCGLKERLGSGEEAALLRVGDKGFGQDDLARFFNSRLQEFRDSADADAAKSALLDSFIEEQLLLRQAEQLKIEPNQQALDSMRENLAASGAGSGGDLKNDRDLGQSMEESLKIQGYLHDHLFKGLSVSKEECEAYYKEHLNAFVSNDVVHVREILVADEAQAGKILALLKANRSNNFNELARLYSKAPAAAAGGDMGTFQRGELPEEFEKVIFPLTPGTASKIVRTRYGYHIFLVEEKILAHRQKYYEVEDKIREKLLVERQRAALDNELASLADTIPIQLDRDRLDFKYVGAGPAARGRKFQ